MMVVEDTRSCCHLSILKHSPILKYTGLFVITEANNKASMVTDWQ